jgi:outer membrane protein W
LAGGSTTTLNETQTNISIPLSLIYTPFSFKKIAPFVRAGAAVNYMLTSVMGGDRQVELAVKPLTGPDFSMLESRNPLQVQLVGSLGFTYSLKNSYVLFDVRYYHGLMEQTTSKKAPEAPNADLSPMYLYTENDFRMNNIAVSVGLFYKFYKPRKR